MRERLDEIVSFAELERFIDLPVRTYSSGMHMRLGFAIAVHVDADILLLDEVFAVGDEAFQRKCIDKILEFKQRGGTVCFVSHSAAAVERLCERAMLLSQGRGRVRRPTSEALKRYHKALALEESPEEVGAELREWGSGEVRVAWVAVGGGEGSRTRAGSCPASRWRSCSSSSASRRCRRRSCRSSCGTRAGRCSARAAGISASSAGTAPGERELRFAIDHLPLGEGEFQVSVALTDAAGSRRYHRIDAATHFAVEPSDGARGAAAPRGRVVAGRRGYEGRGWMSSRTCPDWPELTEIAPDLQFKHYTVAEARLPADALVQLGDFPLGAVAICADLDKNVFYAVHTDPQVAEALRDTHWYEVREWATSGQGGAA